jgi:sigma-B regulation protein RsbU (phosphoserine phosphatase)
MKIRTKLLILLLLISLGPLIAASVLHRVAMRRLGSRLASGRREILIDRARRHLRQVVDEYARTIARDEKALTLALTIQAREVERRLVAPPPPSPVLFFGEDYDRGMNRPPGMKTSETHLRMLPDGRRAPIPVTYQQQVCILAGGVSREAVADDLARLSTMPEVYRFLHGFHPDLMYWQYTALESGVHTSYPGHGGYDPGYDPRTRPWYLRARDSHTSTSDQHTWFPPIPDVSTGMVTLGLSMPVRRPDGSFAGVTAIDVPIRSILGKINLPRHLAQHAETMIVSDTSPWTPGDDRLLIVAARRYGGHGQDWRKPVRLQTLTSGDPDELEALRRDAQAGESGVREMAYRGRRCVWAHGAAPRGAPFPIVIVPRDAIVAEATEAEGYVLEQTVLGLTRTSAMLLVVIVVVVTAAYFASRSVTRPVSELATAAQRLAGGDYRAKVHIRTRDELHDLADAFNGMGPKLAEREHMKRSLELAMEIQQHLLPQEPPEVEGFDIAGRSVYCDETGGDYYDFIELIELGPGKLGLALGDVTGHGIGAALLMASARGVLRSHAGRHGANLAALFDALNEHLVRDTGEERFMTLFYGVLDARARTLTWASGGHDPALWLRRSSGQFEELPNTGVPLGILEGVAYEQGGPITIEGGDIVCIGTDGIWEARNPDDDMFGKQRLRELLSQRAEEPAAEIHAAVVAAVHAFRGARAQEDDITLIVIKAL